ncbi:uncharacterized protein G2W53_007527 [Senna tora]|uniref:Uncharacterized protein n=1 Tax=Senna tora TaxID=362788 RepID=A0A834X6Y3_9FABA|nr:uncharacterized protein G2W53_007527 [Senna tora]
MATRIYGGTWFLSWSWPRHAGKEKMTIFPLTFTLIIIGVESSLKRHQFLES